MDEIINKLFPNDYPIKMLSSRVWRQYIGGYFLDEFLLGKPGEDYHFPEDWIGSTVRAFNSGRETIEEGESVVISPIDNKTTTSLKELLEIKGKEILGESHCRYIGNEPGILVKLLDSAVRLAIQTHPSKESAIKYFGAKYGKTESWYILNTRKINGVEPHVYLGFKEGVTKEEWERAFWEQNIEKMLSMLHKFNVSKGDMFFVRHNIPHCIGPGCFVCEVQEPSDLIFRTELKKIDGSFMSIAEATMGLGVDEMMNNFDYNGLSKEETLNKYKIEPHILFIDTHASFKQLLGYDVSNCFEIKQLDLLEGNFKIPGAHFCIAIIADGSGEIKMKSGEFSIKKGDYLILPHSLDYIVFEGKHLSVLLCYPSLL